ncbi:MAG TPA: CD225/dispanin family protein [Gemmataceae bacterium]|jgi:hypothetical protein|nr:CD225/dispanin family protein [Gemmataceae bacterium]
MPRDPDGFTDEPERPRRHDEDDYPRRRRYEADFDVRREDVPNYLVPAIVVTVLCGCWPLGLVAIINAAQVDGKLKSGDLEGARRAANLAKTFTWVTFGVGLVVNTLVFIFVVAAEAMK